MLLGSLPVRRISGLKRNIEFALSPNATRAARYFADFTRTGLKGTWSDQVAPAIATRNFPLAAKIAFYRTSRQVFPTGSSKSAFNLKRVKFQVP
jgi:hypothetical protein